VPMSGGLTIQFPDDREPIHIRFEVSEADVPILERYTTALRALMQAIDRMGGLPARLNVSWEIGQAVQFKSEEPTPDQRAALMHYLRPLILTNEPGSFDRVSGALKRSSDHEFIRDRLRRFRDIFAGSDLRDAVVISRGDLALNSESAFQHWLNGFEYHQEEERAAKVAQPGDALPIEAVRPIFMMMLVEKIKAMSLLGQVVEKMLASPNSVDPVA
jgi:hypothetical protein